MRKVLITIFLPFLIILSYSQTCLPGSNTFNTQEEIDSFAVNNPGCTEIEGDLNLTGDIQNLNGLSVITKIWGFLQIGNTSTLNSLSGLENLESVGGLWIVDNDSLADLDSLYRLNIIYGSLELIDNPMLTNINGLSNLDLIISGGLYIYGNDLLVSLHGLEGLDGIPGSLHIGYFDSGQWSSYCNGNISLKNLQGLNNVHTIGGDLQILGNDSLVSLSGLENLIAISGELIIGSIGTSSFCGNHSLSDISSIENLNAETIDYLLIMDNTSLSNCHILSVCNYLASSSVGYFSQNDFGCNSPEEVLDSCEANAVNIDEDNIKDNLLLYPNPSSGVVHLKYSISDIRYSIFVVYSLQGVKVRTLLNEVQQPGEYELSFDISDLPAGIYIVEATVGGKKVREKLVVE